MRRDVNFLNQTMEEVLAPLPPEDVIQSSREVVRNYLEIGKNKVGRIKWAEFELNGTFVRGGIVNATQMSSRLIFDWTDDQTIEEIVAHAQLDGVKAGDLIEAKNGGGHYWCVPYRKPGMTAGAANRLRAIFLTEALFTEILDMFNENARLTPAEKHMVYQVTIGLNPNRAAQYDGVSTETRRSQLKAATLKLDCHSQIALVRLMVSQLIHLLYICESETSNLQLIEQFGTRFFGPSARLSVQCLPNGRVMRFWEFGPVNGRPLLVMHGFLFGFLVLDGENEFLKNNIRLVMPLRCGYLDEKTASGSRQLEKLASENIEDLLLFTKCIFDEPVPIMGHNMGGMFAMLLAKTRPELFSNVTIASIMLMQDKARKSSIAAKFASGLKKLAEETGIYEYAAKQMQKKVFSNEYAARHVLGRLFRDSPHDLDVVNGKRGSGPAFDWFRQIAMHCIDGFVSDLSLISRSQEHSLRDIHIPVRFVHGPGDPYTSVRELQTFASTNTRATCKILADGGHYVSASHPAEFWKEISWCFEPRQ